MSAGGHNGEATCWNERAGGGSATAIRPAVVAGEDRVIRETCRTRSVRVTEEATATVTERGKLIGVTETCTRERKEQLRRKARMRYAEIVKEQGVKQREGRERLKEKARLTYVKIMERRQKEAETNRHEERLHDTDGVRDAHTHTEVARLNGGELAQRVETRCGQRDSLLRERRETLCPLEATHDQVGSVVPDEFEGTSEANGCTPSLGGMETPGALEVVRVPSVIVPVCAVKGVSETPCVDETPRVSAPAV